MRNATEQSISFIGYVPAVFVGSASTFTAMGFTGPFGVSRDNFDLGRIVGSGVVAAVLTYPFAFIFALPFTVAAVVALKLMRLFSLPPWLFAGALCPMATALLFTLASSEPLEMGVAVGGIPGGVLGALLFWSIGVRPRAETS
jgi:hypothetical protein